MESTGPWKGRCLFLMLSLLALLLIHPFFQHGAVGQTVLILLNSATLLGGIYAVSDKRRYLAIGLAIALPQLALAWIGLVLDVSAVQIPSIILIIVFYGYTLVRVLVYVLRGPDVTRDKIYGAVSVYLLAGLAWASAYFLLETLQPGSFYVDEAHKPTGTLRLVDFIYYSLVTLTTLGYGEIAPIAAQARALAALEAVGGVLYVAVLVARLVGLYRPETKAGRAPGR